MMKIFFFFMFMILMVICNKKIMFYYNLYFLMSMGFLFKFMFKDSACWVSLSFMWKFDFYSFYLILLSIWVLGLMLMVIQLQSESLVKLLVFLIMGLTLIMLFSMSNLMIFYLIFELSLIPIFIVIIYWGYNFERLSASFYLLMYTMFISLPLLIYIMKLFKVIQTFEISLLKMNNIEVSLIDYLILFMAFLIKMPVFLFHLWLPKAHVEAPVYGSMILAAVLLKLGSYGLLRFIEIFYMSSSKYSYVFMGVGITGSIYISMVCMVQVDMKSLVAYSSVVHMNMMLCCLYTMMKLSFVSSYILMVSHGVCSSGLFFMVNLYYERSLSRLMFFNKGMLSIYPSLSLWWLIFCAMNFSFPLSLNFISEVFMISVLVSWDFMMMVYLVIICLFNSAYSLYLYSYIQHGSVYIENKSLHLVYLKDYLIIIMHFIPLIMFLFNLVMVN